MRTLGLRVRAVADLPALPAETPRAARRLRARRQRLDRCKGRLAAPEFLAFGTPRPWTAVDSLLWGKTMSLYLPATGGRNAAGSLQEHFKPAEVDELWPDATGRRPARGAAGGTEPIAAVSRPGSRDHPRIPAPFTLPDSAQRLGGRRPPHRQRRAAARRRPASRLRLPGSGFWPGSRPKRACWPARPRPACRSW